MHLHLRWQRISRLQFEARSQDFHAELVPVHSPLLRESSLDSYPPLTYMLKFSGSADLTSCLVKSTAPCSRGHSRRKATRSGRHFTHCLSQKAHSGKRIRGPYGALTRRRSQPRSQPRNGRQKKHTEAGTLLGISQKRSARSSPCWFTEFCKSQCLSHFAAPFIVVRAETSVAESCWPQESKSR